MNGGKGMEEKGGDNLGPEKKVIYTAMNINCHCKLLLCKARVV